MQSIRFCEHNRIAFGLSMWTVLLMCFQSKGIAYQLYATKNMDNPAKSLQRLQRTQNIVMDWLLCDDAEELKRTVTQVKAVHDYWRDRLTTANCNRQPNNPINQKEFEFIQFAFVGMLYLNPAQYSFKHCTDENMLHFSHQWAHIMTLLGVSNDNNLCKVDDTCTEPLETIRVRMREQLDILKGEIDKDDVEQHLISNMIDSVGFPLNRLIGRNMIYHFININWSFPSQLNRTCKTLTRVQWFRAILTQYIVIPTLVFTGNHLRSLTSIYNHLQALLDIVDVHYIQIASVCVGVLAWLVVFYWMLKKFEKLNVMI